MQHAHSFSNSASPALLCPITMELMLDPVIDANGNTFERVAIERALEHKPGICPLSNAEYTAGAARLMPNRVVRNLVDEYLKRTEKGAEVVREAEDARTAAEARQLVVIDVIALHKARDFCGLVRALAAPDNTTCNRAMEALTDLAQNSEILAFDRSSHGVPQSSERVFSWADSGVPPAAPFTDISALYRNKDFNGLVRALNSEVPATCQRTAEAFRDLARNLDLHRAIVEAGAVKPLVTLVQNGSSEAKEEAAMALRNLATGNLNNREAIVRAGGVLPLVGLLQDGWGVTWLAATRALGALGCDRNTQREIVQAGAIQLLVMRLRATNHSGRATVVSLLGKFAADCEETARIIVQAGAVETLGMMVRTKNRPDGKLFAKVLLERLLAIPDLKATVFLQSGGYIAGSKYTRFYVKLTHKYAEMWAASSCRSSGNDIVTSGSGSNDDVLGYIGNVSRSASRSLSGTFREH